MNIRGLLALSVKEGASDLHLSVGMSPMLRLDGDLQPLDLPPLEADEADALLGEIMDDARRREHERRRECDFALEVPGLARFRVNVFNQNRGAGAVFRVIPAEIKSLDELGAGRVFRDIALMSPGLILVTGPTGSGKSSTLAALLDHVNSRQALHLLTIEDPIEFVHQSRQCLVTQREVGRDTPSFSDALRAALREDPDIILVGEMRDLATIRLALEAAETGHTVFATLHTGSAAKAIDRIIDVFPAGEQAMVRALLSESLRAVVSQCLLKQVGGGRCAAHEVMICTPAIQNLIREGKVAQMYSAIQTGGRYGMTTLDQSLKQLLACGRITREVAAAGAKHPENFR